MFFTLILENQSGEQLNMSTTANQYMTSKVEGLNPPAGTISTSSYAEMNGSYLNNAFIEKRNIVINFEMRGMLSKVHIPESVKKIGTYSFSGTSLTSVKIAPDCAYSDTSFPSDCVVEFYGDGDYGQLYDADRFALLDAEGARIYSRSENNG